MIEKMRKGYVIGRSPFGYTQMRIDGDQNIVINEKGEILRQAFIWKADLGMSTAQIADRLHEFDIRVS